MQATTYGPYPAAAVLAAELDALGDDAVRRKVSRLMQDLNTGLAQLEGVEDESYRRRFALLWRDDVLRRVTIHPAIDKFVCNVVRSSAKGMVGEV